MSEVVDGFLLPRFDPLEKRGVQKRALLDSIELKYQICLLFEALQRDEEGDEKRYGVFDSAWVMEQFRELLHVSR